MYVCYFIGNKLYKGIYSSDGFTLYEEHKDLFTDFIKLIENYDNNYILCFEDNVDKLHYDKIIYPFFEEKFSKNRYCTRNFLWSSKHSSKIIFSLITKNNLNKLTITTRKVTSYLNTEVYDIGWNTITKYADKDLIKRTINKYPWDLDIIFTERMEFNKIFKYYLLNKINIYIENKIFMIYLMRVDKNRRLRKNLILQDICKKVDLSNKTCYKLLFSLLINHNKNLITIGDIKSIYNLFNDYYK